MNIVRAEHLKGAANELKAASYYMDNGCIVYFPVCQQGAVDFIIDREGKLCKVQVKTAYYNGDHLQCRIRQTNIHQHYKPWELYDILFIVYNDQMWEVPAVEIHSSNISLHSKITNKKYVWDKYRL